MANSAYPLESTSQCMAHFRVSPLDKCSQHRPRAQILAQFGGAGAPAGATNTQRPPSGKVRDHNLWFFLLGLKTSTRWWLRMTQVKDVRLETPTNGMYSL